MQRARIYETWNVDYLFAFLTDKGNVQLSLCLFSRVHKDINFK